MSERARRHVALAVILAVAALLRAWAIGQNGWGADYYTAAVRSMAQGWHNCWYVAFDPAGFMSVDKPPVALWVQVAAVKLFGFHPLSVLLPQVVAGVACVAIAMVVAMLATIARARPLVSATFAVIAMLALPLAWALSSVLVPGQGILPSADVYRLLVAKHMPQAIEAARLGQSPDTHRLASFLQAQRNGERFIVTTTTTRLAAPLVIETGEAVLARGGFHGLDEAVTPQSLERMVAAREVRFAIVGDLTPVNRALGAERPNREVTEWIRAHGKPVAGTAWRGPGMGRGVRLYDLAPAVQASPPATAAQERQ
jgi:4-amino-4-deoxy-L-arabinose transferase-like glycosyltransferase